MRKHIIVLASIFILLGTFLGILFVNGHLEFLSISSSLFSERSALEGNLSVFQKLGNFLNVYFEYFGQFGINPLNSLLVIITSLLFGYGLLKSRNWSRNLGFLIILLNTFSSLYAMFIGAVSLAVIIQLGLCAYMWWILTSDEAKGLLKKKLN
jgi:ABC-type glycerol-3-phosphate transport system permease component